MDDFFAYIAFMVDLSVPSVLCEDLNAVLNRYLDGVITSTFDSPRDSSAPSLAHSFFEFSPTFMSVSVTLYCSPLNFPFSSLVKTDHVVRYRAGPICH